MNPDRLNKQIAICIHRAMTEIRPRGCTQEDLIYLSARLASWATHVIGDDPFDPYATDSCVHLGLRARIRALNEAKESNKFEIGDHIMSKRTGQHMIVSWVGEELGVWLGLNDSRTKNYTCIGFEGEEGSKRWATEDDPDIVLVHPAFWHDGDKFKVIEPHGDGKTIWTITDVNPFTDEATSETCDGVRCFTSSAKECVGKARLVARRGVQVLQEEAGTT